MANRQAIRDLQSRLAGRLQAARTEGASALWLAVQSAGTRYLFPLTQSGEIFPWTSAQAVPYTHEWFLGVANLRGGLYGVVDLASFVLGRPPVTRTDSARGEARLVALGSSLDINCALLIDRLAGLRSADAFVASSARAPEAPDFFGNRYTDAEGAHWQEINLQALSLQPQFLSISA